MQLDSIRIKWNRNKYLHMYINEYMGVQVSWVFLAETRRLLLLLLLGRFVMPLNDAMLQNIASGTQYSMCTTLTSIYTACCDRWFKKSVDIFACSFVLEVNQAHARRNELAIQAKSNKAIDYKRPGLYPGSRMADFFLAASDVNTWSYTAAINSPKTP